MAFDAYLKIDSIPGECTDKGHEDWIQLLAFNHGVNQPHKTVTAGGGSRGGVERCEHQDFTITKHIDKSTPKLNLHCCNGKNLQKVKVEICRQVDSKIAYMTYEFETCLVRSVAIHGNPAGSGDVPVEEVRFSYAKINWKYTQVDPKSNQPKGDTMSYWDMLSNTGG
jgi:type VI secretion system secreted protein Hcp